MPPAKYLLWIDLETSGTDETKDPILEVGAIVTTVDPPFEVIFESEGVFKPPELFFVDWRERIEANEVVKEMHTKNGLLEAVDAVGGDIVEFERVLVDDLREIGKKHEFLLAGSGVAHFDRRFIDAQMPALAGMLQYPVMDVGVVRRMFRLAGNHKTVEACCGSTWEGGKPHRGLDDVRDHLEEFRRYADWIADSRE